jgi:hypothetical protein
VAAGLQKTGGLFVERRLVWPHAFRGFLFFFSNRETHESHETRSHREQGEIFHFLDLHGVFAYNFSSFSN